MHLDGVKPIDLTERLDFFYVSLVCYQFQSSGEFLM